LANQAIHSPTLNWYLCAIAESNIDPFTINVFQDPRLRAGQWEDFTMGADISSELLDASYKSLMSGFPEFVVPSYRKFMEVFTTNMQKYYAEEVTAQKAMDDTAKEWSVTIDRIGKDKIRQYYSEIIKQMPP